MPISQNVVFSGAASRDEEFPHPEGYSVAKSLSDDLGKYGWNVSEVDNWRDAGWSLIIRDDDSELELSLSKQAEGVEWFLQISPSSVPRLFGRLFGRKASAAPETIIRLADDVHQLLLVLGFTGMKWCWDGYPEEGNSSAVPSAIGDA